MIFIADLIACSTCFGDHYAHHQELESIIQVAAAWHITLSTTPYRQLENQASNTTGSSHLYNTLELLMMGIMFPETCWTSNKICNKNHLLHLVGVFISEYYTCLSVLYTLNVFPLNQPKFPQKLIFAYSSFCSRSTQNWKFHWCCRPTQRLQRRPQSLLQVHLNLPVPVTAVAVRCRFYG